MIRKTYHAPESAKSVFQEKNKNVTLHVGAKVPNIGDATGSAAWWDAQHAGSGWIVHRVSATSSHTRSELIATDCPILFGVLHINRRLFAF